MLARLILARIVIVLSLPFAAVTNAAGSLCIWLIGADPDDFK